ncbi:MAG: hypothetical protein ACI9P8_001288 [Bacteroidia bacterium]|jgi:hypothetical protein
MRPQLVIIRLVNSLNRTEASSVVSVLEADGSGQARMELELFRAIRRSRSNDPEQFVGLLESEKLSTYLSKFKQDLKQRILNQLAEKVTDTDHLLYTATSKILNHIRALWNKGLTQDALADVIKLEQKCANGPLALRLVVAEEHHRMLRSRGGTNRAALVEKHGAELMEHLNAYQNQKGYERLEEEAFAIYTENRASDHEEVKRKIGLIADHPLIKNMGMVSTFEAKRSFLMVKIVQARLLNNRQDKIKYLEGMVELWDDNPGQITRRPFVHQVMMINLLNGYYHAGYRKDFEQLYERVQRVALKSKNEQAAILISLLSVKLLFYMNTRQLDAALAMKHELANGIKDYFSSASYVTAINLVFNTGSLFFLTDKKTEAKKWFRKVVAEGEKVRFDLQAVARVMILLCEMKRETSELVIPNIRTIKRFFANHEELDNWEFVVFKYLIKIMNSPPDQESRYLFEVHGILTELDVRNSDTLGGEAVMCWLEARLQGSSVRQVFESSVAVF